MVLVIFPLSKCKTNQPYTSVIPNLLWSQEVPDKEEGDISKGWLPMTASYPELLSAMALYLFLYLPATVP